MNGRVAEEMTEARKEVTKVPRAANLIGTVTRVKGARARARARVRARARAGVKTRHCYDCGEQGYIGMNCPYKWANSIDEEDDQTSSCESEPEGEKSEEEASLETRDEEGEWCWPKKGRVTRWRRRIDSRPAFHYLAEDDEGEQASGGLNHLVPRNAGGAQWTWKKVTVVVDSQRRL